MIEEDQKQMINNVFEFDDRTVGEIMTHRTDMDTLEVNDDLDEVLHVISSSGHSRIPVYEEDVDHIVGMLYFKDLTNVLIDEYKRSTFKIADYMREPIFVYENLKCDDLFAELQKRKVQVAIVLDEYGGTFGVVTMEDLLESIVGDIQDEYDNEDEEIEEVNETHFIVDAATLISDLAEELDINIDEGENDTIGGLIMDHLGHVPEEDEDAFVTLGAITFKVKSMDGYSIDKVDVIIDPDYQEEKEEDEDE